MKLGLVCCAACCTLLLQLAAANLLVMMHDPNNPLQPYFETLPKPDELLAPLVHTPDEYFPVLQSDILVGYSIVRGLRV